MPDQNFSPERYPYDRDPYNGRLFKDILNVIKLIKEWINKKSGKKTGKTDPVNGNSSPESIEKITQLLNNFRLQIREYASGIEKAALEEVNSYTEELLDILKADAEKTEKYGIHINKFEKKIGKIPDKLHGCMDRVISKKISLDNIECRNVLKMIPGEKKEEAMRGLLNAALNEALNACCEELRSCLNEIFEDSETEIIGALETLQKQTASLNDMLNSVDENNFEESSQRQIAKSYYCIEICDHVLQMI